MNLIDRLRQDYPQFRFVPGEVDCWSARLGQVTYSQPVSAFDLLHEVGHALAGHQTYDLDIELLHLEVEAWQLAKKLGRRYRLRIGRHYIQAHLQTYKDWLRRRALCPACDLVSLQAASGLYICPNCNQSWRVPKCPQAAVRRLPTKQPLG